MTATPDLEELSSEALGAIDGAGDLEGLDSLRVRYLGKKGQLTAVLHSLGSLPPDERAGVGRRANELKRALTRRIEDRRSQLEQSARTHALSEDTLDLTLPGEKLRIGRPHPLTQVTREIVGFFRGLGFEVVDGPEAEVEYYNFEALNMPEFHPARDMQDSFYLTNGTMLRTHTSNVQIRCMESRKPPLRVLAPGKVYRRDSDVTHSPVFHQIEGFMVDRNVSFANLKSCLTSFAQAVFGAERKVRFRASFFPFTEPSAEVDVECIICGGAGEVSPGRGQPPEMCRICKGTGWLEILGSGMIHPKVFASVGYDPEEFTGFAFGMGVERIAMLKYGINDIRLFFENDMRFLSQF